jgi:hypothetical protein
MSTTIPNPSAQHVATWLQKVTPEYLQNDGWREANSRFQGIVAAARTYAQEHFGGQLEQQEAFFDGLALALAALTHFADVEQLRDLFEAETTPAEGEVWLQGA